MSLPIEDFSTRQVIINNDYGQWGTKINNIQQELAELVNLKRTEIIQWKIEFEDTINSMELIDLYYLNVRARYVQ